MKRPRYVDLSRFFVKYAFNTRFFLGRLTQKSNLFKKIIDKFLFEDDEIFVIPNTQHINKNEESKNHKTNKENNKSKNITTNIQINETIEESESTFLPTEILKEAVRRASHIVIMDTCLCRVSNDCEDYPQDIGCIFMGPTAKKIPKHIGKEATVEEALNHIDKADAAGLSHIIGRNKIDTVWMNIGPKEELLTVCHCCPCCCLWKVLPDINEEIGDRLKKLDGVNVKINNETCINCKQCLKEEVCFAKAIFFNEDTQKMEIDQNKCRGCGKCIHICKKEAISIEYESESINPILDRIEELVKYN